MLVVRILTRIDHRHRRRQHPRHHHRSNFDSSLTPHSAQRPFQNASVPQTDAPRSHPRNAMPPKTPAKRKRSLSGLSVDNLSAAWAAGLAAHSSPTRSNTHRRDTLLAALEVLNCQGVVATSNHRVAERIEASGVLLHTEYTPMHLVYLVWAPLIEHVASF